MDSHTTVTTVPKKHHGATRQTVMSLCYDRCTSSFTFLLQQTFIMEIHGTAPMSLENERYWQLPADAAYHSQVILQMTLLISLHSELAN